MINQLLAGVHIAAAAEAMALGLREGVDAAALYEVITHSAGNSWMFENRMAHVLAGDYTPLSAVDIFVKDLGLVLDTARATKFPLPLSATAMGPASETSARPRGEEKAAFPPCPSTKPAKEPARVDTKALSRFTVRSTCDMASTDVQCANGAPAAARIHGAGGRESLDGLPLPARTLERHFRAEVGLSPKRLARIVRFHGVVGALDRGRPGETYLFGGRSEGSNLSMVRSICPPLKTTDLPTA